MKRINVGETNDLTQYAAIMGYDERNNPVLVPLDEDDLRFQPADVEIGYDSGLYIMSLEEIPGYICRRAARQLVEQSND